MEPATKGAFTVNRDLRSYHHDVVASSVLEKSGIRNCIVGELTNRIYGRSISDVIFSIHIIVDDDNVDKAASVLLAHGCEELTDRPRLWRESSGNPWRSFTGADQWSIYDGTVVIQPASIWHLSKCLKDIETCTVLYDKPMARFPRVDLYVTALIDILCQDSKMPTGDDLPSLNYYIALLVEEQLPGIRGKLPPSERFFVDNYFKGTVESTPMIIDLRKKIKSGEIKADDAKTLLKEKHPQQWDPSKPAADVLAKLGFIKIFA